ncbi:MAG: amidohydrolase family protein [Deltaproteobacteria bacterium]|nr:amidohydrolase family protein [Deltaproteobacteria bacterium]
MTYDLIIRNGTVVDPANNRCGIFDVGIAAGRIAAVEREIPASPSCKVYDAGGRLVMPGLVDTHVHLTPPRRSIGFKMLAQAGVTTALDCSGLVPDIIEGMARNGSGINVAVLNRLVPGDTVSVPNAGKTEIESFIERSLLEGALGIKLLGGHIPLTPEATANAIELANRQRCYAAFHCGSTKNGSNLLGLQDALELTGENHLHICHVNAYCRGYTHSSPVWESYIALRELAQRRRLVSESHIAPYNSCGARLDASVPRSHVTRASLIAGGYDPTAEGLKESVRNGHCKVQRITETGVVYADPEEGLALLQRYNFEVMISFPVNHRSTAFLMATEKDNGGRFIVTALSTDGGGIPRNFLLSHGLSLVKFEALTIEEFVTKSAWKPALMLGLHSKGHLGEGADADIAVVDYEEQRADLVIAGGQIIAEQGEVMGMGGALVTTERGRASLEAGNIHFKVTDLDTSLFYSALED